MSSSKGKSKRKERFNEMAKHKIFRKRNILPICCFIMSIIIIISVIKLTFIPSIIGIIVSSSLIILSILGTILINVHKKKPLKIIGTIILMFIAVFNIFGIYVFSKTDQFLKSGFTTNSKYTQSTYYLLSKSEKTANEITGYIGLYSEMNNKEGSIEKITSKYELSPVEYPTIDSLISNLNNNVVEFIIIDKKIYNSLINEKYGYDKSSYNTLYEFDIYNKYKKVRNKTSDKFNVYFEILDENGISKYNNLLTVNLKNNKVLSTTIPRELYVPIAEKINRYDKLENLPIYGDETVNTSVEQLLGTTIDYNVKINEKELISLARKLKVQYADELITDIDDMNRIMNENNLMEIVENIITKIIKDSNLKEYGDYLDMANTCYETDMPKEMIFKILKNITKKGLPEIERQSITGNYTSGPVFSSNLTDNIITIDNDSLTETINKIIETLN